MFLHLSQSTDLECSEGSEKVLTVWGSLPLWGEQTAPADSAPITVLLPSLYDVCLHSEKLNENKLKQINKEHSPYFFLCKFLFLYGVCFVFYLYNSEI